MTVIRLREWSSCLSLVPLSLLGFWLGGIEVGLTGMVLVAALVHTDRSRRRGILRVQEASLWRVTVGQVAGALAAGADLQRALEIGAARERAWEIRKNGPRDRLRSAAKMIRMGGDPIGVIGNDHPWSAYLSTCLAVSQRLGIAVRPILIDLADSVAQRQQVAREVSIALASARATARLLAILPLAGIGLAELMSPSSIHDLFDGPLGRGCLAIAAILEAAGLMWVQRISDRAVR